MATDDKAFMAICTATKYENWATGPTEEKAEAKLWNAVRAYLQDYGDENASMSDEELVDYYGMVMIDLSNGSGNF